MCLESGLTRSKNSINVAVKNFADFGISVALFWAFGYAIMFSRAAMGGIDPQALFFDTTSNPGQAAFFLFEAMFCSTATTIVSGASAERMKFGAYVLVAALTAICLAAALKEVCNQNNITNSIETKKIKV